MGKLSDMLLSVIIPWHRNRDDLNKAVNSVLAQTWHEFEIIIVANGVTDEICLEVANAFTDPRIRVVFCPDKGASPARNMGMELAQGELLYFLDADDIFLPEKLRTFAETYQTEPFDLAFSRAVRDRGNGVETLMPTTFWDGSVSIAEFFFVVPGNISTSAIVITKKAAAMLRFEASATPYEDTDFVIQAEHMGLRLRMLPQPLFRWSDFRSEGRLSKMVNSTTRLAWIASLPESVPERARAAYRARCVAQHVFPSKFGMCLGFFADAIRLRAVPIHQVFLFMIRGLIPSAPQRWLMDRYLHLRMRGGREA